MDMPIGMRIEPGCGKTASCRTESKKVSAQHFITILSSDPLRMRIPQIASVRVTVQLQQVQRYRLGCRRLDACGAGSLAACYGAPSEPALVTTFGDQGGEPHESVRRTGKRNGMNGRRELSRRCVCTPR